MRRTSTPSYVLYLIYLAALAMAVALMVFWVLVVQRFSFEINQLLSHLGVEWSHFHWFVATTGAGLIFLVIVALTYLLAITLSERRYRVKQEFFLSSLTHELKSPVAAVKLHAQTLQQGGLADQEVAQFATYIVAEADRVAQLVDKLLESSRLTSGHGRDLEPIRLRDFFQRYQTAVRSRFDLREVDLRFEIHTRAVVMATSDALQRIMDNLIDNAIRFTGKGGEIVCQVRDRLGDTVIVVGDNGVGIPKPELTKVFEAFYRLQREVEGRRKGTGLGLAIVRGLVEEMRGRVRAFSGDGQPGTRIEIRLPQADDREPPRSDDGAPASSTASFHGNSAGSAQP
jgi:signal transduction histidine kinase